MINGKKMNLKTESYRQTPRPTTGAMTHPAKNKGAINKNKSIIEFAYVVKRAFMPQETRLNLLPLPLHLHCRPYES